MRGFNGGQIEAPVGSPPIRRVELSKSPQMGSADHQIATARGGDDATLGKGAMALAKQLDFTPAASGLLNMLLVP